MLPFDESYRCLRESAGWCGLATESVIRLTGADVVEWVQGQSTNDMSTLSSDRAVEFFFCKPTGQIVSPATAWREGESILLLVPTECKANVLSRCEQMVVMEDVSAALAPRPMWTVQGPGTGQPSEGIQHDRCGFGGFDGWGAPPIGIPEIDPLALDLVALESGVPRFGVDYGDSTLPPELGQIVERRAVSYTKGCYTGQEVLMRIHSRGHTNKTWTLLSIPDEISVREVLQGASQVGRIARVLRSPRLGRIASAILRNEAMKPGEPLTVEGRPATLVSLLEG